MNKIFIYIVLLAVVLLSTNCKKDKTSASTPSMQIEAGYKSTFVIKADGTLWATGYNDYALLGDGTNINRYALVKIADSVAAVSSSKGDGKFTMVLKKDNTLWAVGVNVYGQFGNGTTTSTFNLIKVMDNVRAVSAGLFSTMIIKTDNSLWASGENSFGQLGLGNTNNIKTFTKIMDNVKSVSVGFYHSLVLKTNNTLWATGKNSNGELGDGTYVDKKSFIFIMDNVRSMQVGQYCSLLIKTDDTLWTTGYNKRGELGTGGTDEKSSRYYKAEDDNFNIIGNIRKISVGENFTLLIKNDNSLWAAGRNSYGEFGDGNINYSNLRFKKLQDYISDVTTGKNHTIILKTDNTTWLAGLNSDGQLGDGTFDQRNTFVPMYIP